MTLRDLLNKHLWHHDDLDDIDIVVIHRGAPRDQRVVSGADITAIGSRGIEIESFADDEEDASVYIPYARFLEVRVAAGVLWSKPPR